MTEVGGMLPHALDVSAAFCGEDDGALNVYQGRRRARRTEDWNAKKIKNAKKPERALGLNAVFVVASRPSSRRVLRSEGFDPSESRNDGIRRPVRTRLHAVITPPA
ncbi:MAG TPA: hypothetical protein VGC55_08195 [Dokdonella sp.]